MSNSLRALPLVLLFLIPCTGSAQYAYRATPPPAPDVINPEPRYWFLAPQIGLNLNTHPGDFIPEKCSDCIFSDGSGTGLLLGIQLEHWINPFIGFALKFVYDDKRASYTTLLPPREFLVLPDGSDKEVSEMVQVERSSDVRLSYLMFHPVLEIFPVKFFYVFAGPAVGIPVTREYTHDERIVDEGYTFLTTKQMERTIDEGREIRDVKTPRLDIRAGVGLQFRLSPSVLFAPEVSYEFPLTRISGDPNWEAQSIHLVAVLKFEL